MEAALTAFAGRLEDAAGQVRWQLGVLAAAGHGTWSGAAATAFGERVDDARADVHRFAAALDDAAAALREHAARAASRAEELRRSVPAAVAGARVAAGVWW